MAVPSTRKTLDPQPGTLIGGVYEIERLLARGGVGVVYVARDKSSGREVVVKVLAGHLSGETEARARFDREVERLSSLQHANIVEVLDHGYENGAPFLVMEFLSGEPLLDYLTRKGKLTLAEFVPIAAQVLKALGFAHGRGMMHRDIKPGNIMLIVRKGRANFVKLLDFGMAKLVEGERDITSEQILGTANYMAPEQVRGDPLDARVDVYACGLLFYRMLSGKLPFVAENNAALLYKQVHEIPPPLASVMPAGHEAPDELLSLIDRCLAKDPNDRPADANALTEALVGCVPAQLFRLPLADGVDPSSAMSSTTGALPDTSSTAMTGPQQQTQESSSGAMRKPTRGHRRTGARPVRERTNSLAPAEDSESRSGSTGSVAALRGSTSAQPVLVMPPPPSSSPWPLFVGIGVLVLGLVGFLAFGGGSGPSAGSEGAAASNVDERKLSARLDQVDQLILSGDFPKAQAELAALRPAVSQIPKLATRAQEAERWLGVLIGLEVARKLEQAGDRAAAEKAYRDVLLLDASNAEARSGLQRVTEAPSQPETPPDVEKPKPRPRPKDGKTDAKPDTKVDTKKTDAPKGEDPFTLPTKKKDDNIFLPTGK